MAAPGAALPKNEVPNGIFDSEAQSARLRRIVPVRYVRSEKLQTPACRLAVGGADLQKLNLLSSPGAAARSVRKGVVAVKPPLQGALQGFPAQDVSETKSLGV